MVRSTEDRRNTLRKMVLRCVRLGQGSESICYVMPL